MAITPNQVELVQASFAKVAPIAETAADIFYKKLFEYSPDLKPLFKNDIKSQGNKLMQTLTVAVKGLNDLNALVPVLQKLAQRHVNYGVRAEDFTPVGNALLYTLKAGLGEEFTPQVREAWIAVFRVIATTMKQHSFK